MEEDELLKKSSLYIVDEVQPSLSILLFERALKAGRAGLCLTGEPPVHFRSRLSDPDRAELGWVTDVSGPGALKPAMLDQINAVRERFLDHNEGTVVLLDILHPLASANEWGNVVKFFSYVRDDTSRRDSIVLVSVDSRGIEPHRFRQLRRLAREEFSEERPPRSVLPPLKLENGKSYLLRHGLERGYRAAQAAAREGPVLCLSREPPETLRRMHSLPGSVEVLWLSRARHPGSISPDRPDELWDKLGGFLENPGALLLLDGVELLVAENGFAEFFRIFCHLRDQARLSGGKLVVVLPQTAVTQEEHHRLSREAEVV